MQLCLAEEVRALGPKCVIVCKGHRHRFDNAQLIAIDYQSTRLHRSLIYYLYK